MKKWWGKSVMAYVAEVLVGYAGAVDLYHFSILESKIRGPCFKCIGLDFCKCLFREEKTVSAADLVYGSSADGTGFCWFVGEAAITYSHAVSYYCFFTHIFGSVLFSAGYSAF